MDKDVAELPLLLCKNLFEHTDIDPANYHLPDGMIPKDKVKAHCLDYENKLKKLADWIYKYWALVNTILVLTNPQRHLQ